VILSPKLGKVHGFRLTLAPRTAWADMTRDLVASGAARSGLSLDRFSDLLVLTEQVTVDLLERSTDRDVEVALSAGEEGVQVVVTAQVPPSKVTRLALERMSDRHWVESDDGAHVTGFVMGPGPH
jgi:hypothetical protein